MKTREAVPLVKVLDNETVQQRPYTMVSIVYEGPGGISGRAIGFARCNWRDRWNRNLGVTIARNRAVFNAAAEIAASV